MGLIGPEGCCFRPFCSLVGKSCLAHGDHCVLIQTLAPFHFFLLYRPLTNEEVPGVMFKSLRLAPLWGPTGEDLAVFRFAWIG